MMQSAKPDDRFALWSAAFSMLADREDSEWQIRLQLSAFGP